jgi:DNA-binding MarR family transcriptional regulator
MFEALDRDAFALAKEHEFFEEQRDMNTRHRTITEQFDAALAECGALGLGTVNHVRLLVMAKIHGPRKMTFFIESLGVSSAAGTGMTDKLASIGLIERVRLPHDRRSLFLQLTPMGEDFLSKILPCDRPQTPSSCPSESSSPEARSAARRSA